MSLKIGIIGLPNVGKSTLFNGLIAQKKAQTSDYPFCTIEPNKGIVEVPDQRLEKLGQVLSVSKIVPATLEFVDIAGLVKGAHKGEGLGNEFLSHIQGMDLLCQVLPLFDPQESIKDQKEIVRKELLLKDQHWLNQALEEIKDQKEKKLLEKVKEGFSNNQGVIRQKLTKKEKGKLRKYNLLSDKKIFYLANVKESELETPKKKLKIPANCIIVSAKTEEELIDLDKKDAEEYRKVIGLKENALDQVIAKAYRLLKLISFYTIKEDHSQFQAWPIKKKTRAREAAGQIHTDFAQKFIQAQVISARDLLKANSLAKAAEKGLIKARGEDYPIKDGEVVNFKHG